MRITVYSVTVYSNDSRNIGTSVVASLDDARTTLLTNYGENLFDDAAERAHVEALTTLDELVQWLEHHGGLTISVDSHELDVSAGRVNGE